MATYYEIISFLTETLRLKTFGITRKVRNSPYKENDNDMTTKLIYSRLREGSAYALYFVFPLTNK